MNKTHIAALRQSYTRNELLEENVLTNPYEQFGKWFEEALNAQILEPNAMTLSTISGGRAHGRVVLLKGFDQNGFTFYTNYRSNKGNQIAEVPFVSLTFLWGELERQVRIEGSIEKVSEAESDAYFHSRPRGSQIGAWVSDQSSVITSREVLENRLAELETKFKDLEVIPRPAHWGGYCVIPERIEFWQGRANRLHDRILFTKDAENWKIERLSP
ncbi:Pyridoxine/pyridoxamine 5'-phosphate oxidase [Emticicia oligotrophica DSM 17448]|uniref:Pyridoxine/pyridoxamine 5'-phosphate oxidase n=1 Tax=Emticicia oligotrophica (strain DSM 17448 / CIP 109782 / MTCC 6937 / GPTSA100-15) TaxID=929562 RepID=A0ABM5MX61_EMTOG|nr:pyridoxamine 5'-phosphate oxidase [Emticicia oligotrophica]AFK01616.1 Pyridoxine/pyridoxamine 5'-phosphate oxidase [Emticicia oligotrophica DSM 17448]